MEWRQGSMPPSNNAPAASSCQRSDSANSDWHRHPMEERVAMHAVHRERIMRYFAAYQTTSSIVPAFLRRSQSANLEIGAGKPVSSTGERCEQSR
jgi:hypothetical protein